MNSSLMSSCRTEIKMVAYLTLTTKACSKLFIPLEVILYCTSCMGGVPFRRRRRLILGPEDQGYRVWPVKFEIYTKKNINNKDGTYP